MTNQNEYGSVEEESLNSTEPKEKADFKGKLGKFFVRFAVFLVILWNWDGFWQTNIAPLKAIQSQYFPSKYDYEQLKVSMSVKNNTYIGKIEDRFIAKEESVLQKLENANIKRMESEKKLEVAQNELSKQLEKERVQCRFYDSSLRMIDHLTKKYSEDEIKRTLSCTSRECETILNDRPMAEGVCNIRLTSVST